MNKKQKRSRKKRREQERAKLLRIAKRTHMFTAAQLQPFQYNDGTLVHRVVKDKRNINRNADLPTAQSDYVSVVVWATRCNIVLGVNERSFKSTDKSPTCLACVVPGRTVYDVMARRFW